MKKLSFILAESSLETIPKKIQNHPSVLSHSKRLGKAPSEILLDNSWHYAAMKGIENENKRGRPDIVHSSLLEACSIPLYFEKKISVYIHTINDEIIKINENVRLPKSYHRFVGLIEQLFSEKRIESEGTILLEIINMKFSELIKTINPKSIVGLSRLGKASSYQQIAQSLDDDSCIIIGGFQKGHFSEEVNNTITQLVSINQKPLESHVVTARIHYEYEKTIFM